MAMYVAIDLKTSRSRRGKRKMTDLNTVCLIGNLVKDCGASERDFGYTNSGMARANVTIAVNRSIKRDNEWTDEASFFDVVIWGKMAESLKPYLLKGKKIAVQGTLKQERWKGKDGSNCSRVVINAEVVQLLTKDNGSSGKQQNQDMGLQEDSFKDDGVPF